jgi:hypothetical protein
MNKKEHEKALNAQSVSLMLLQECYNRAHQTNNDAKALKASLSYFPTVLADKATIIEQNPSLFGYIKIIASILYIAIFKKKADCFVIIGR